MLTYKSFATAVLGCTAALALLGCSPKTLDFAQAEPNRGQLYAPGSNEAFNGTLINIPAGTLFNSQRHAEPVLREALNFLKRRDKGLPGLMISDMACEAKVVDGKLQGKAVCADPRSKLVHYEMEFQQGVAHGAFTLHHLVDGNAVATTATFNEGVAEGIQEVFLAEYPGVFVRIRWSGGKLNGVRERFDPRTAILIGRTGYKEDRLEGESVEYALDGKTVLEKAFYKDGKLDGLREAYSPKTGVQTLRGEWTDGGRTGHVQTWTEQGFVIADNSVQRGLSTVSNWNTQDRVYRDGRVSCMDEWDKAKERQESRRTASTDEEATVWRAQCAKGILPG